VEPMVLYVQYSWRCSLGCDPSDEKRDLRGLSRLEREQHQQNMAVASFTSTIMGQARAASWLT